MSILAQPRTDIDPESYAGATGYVNATTADEVVIEGMFRPSDIAEFTANTPVYIFTAQQLDELVDDTLEIAKRGDEK